jgi:hypothetical protein
MISKNTGGPAFPGPYASENGKIEVLWKQQGMTLRDYFAAKAMPSVLPLCETYPYAAQECYAIADAMLKAREA